MSLKKDNENKYVDVDSNYYRQLLAMAGFKILRAPYYQPYCNMKGELSASDFNLAVKPVINGLSSKTSIDAPIYREITADIYMNYYAAWYEKYMNPEDVNQFFTNLKFISTGINIYSSAYETHERKRANLTCFHIQHCVIIKNVLETS